MKKYSLIFSRSSLPPAGLPTGLPADRTPPAAEYRLTGPGSVAAALLPPLPAPPAGGDRLRGGLPAYELVRLQLQLFPLPPPAPAENSLPLCRGSNINSSCPANIDHVLYKEKVS
jgi:hypothetical protein